MRIRPEQGQKQLIAFGSGDYRLRTADINVEQAESTRASSPQETRAANFFGKTAGTRRRSSVQRPAISVAVQSYPNI
jgi:hypothetical protein